MIHEMPFDQDGHITYPLMIDRINSALANNLGNLVNRTVSMQNKYFNGVVANPKASAPLDDELVKACADTIAAVNAHMDTLHVADAVSDIFRLLDRANKYIDETMPWSLAKDPDQISRLATVLYNLLETIRIAAILLEPYMPVTSGKILDQIGTQQRSYDSIHTFGALETGIHVTAKPEILFARLNENDVMEKVEANEKKVAEERRAADAKAHEITINDVGKLDLRVGKVLSCRRHPNAEKLLIEDIDLGNGDVRQIVSGIADSYTPGQMIGKLVVVVANLKPAEIRGEKSQGMILAGRNNNETAVVEVNGLEPGTKIE